MSVLGAGSPCKDYKKENKKLKDSVKCALVVLNQPISTDISQRGTFVEEMKKKTDNIKRILGKV